MVGAITKINGRELTIGLAVSKGEKPGGVIPTKTVKVPFECPVSLNGKRAKFGNLKIGDMVTVQTGPQSKNEAALPKANVLSATR